MLTVLFVGTFVAYILLKKNKIPKEQAVYKLGKSNSELVHVIKTRAEKSIFSNDRKLFLALIGISETLDSTNRAKIFEYLEQILQSDKLHLLSVLTNTPNIYDNVGNDI